MAEQHEQTPASTIITNQWPNTVRTIAGVMFVFALLGLVVFVSPIARNLAAALLFAFLLDMPIRYVSRHTALSYRWTALILYMLLYIAMAALLIVGWRYAAEYLQSAISTISAAASHLLSSLQASPAQTVLGPVSDPLSRLLGAAVQLLLAVLAAPVRAYGRLAGVIVQVGFFIFLSNLLVFSGYGARGGLRKWIPDPLYREACILLSYGDRIWGNYLAGMGLFAIVLGAGSIVEYWLLGVPYPVVFGVMTGVISLIPFIGGILSDFIVFIPCLLLGSSRFPELNSLLFAVVVALINGVVTQVSYNFVALPIIGKLVKLPYWVVLSGVMLGAAFNSILFAFLVIPIFSTLRVAYTYLLAKIEGLEPFPGIETPAGPAKGFLSQFLLGHDE